MNPFDQHGNIRRDLDEREILTLPEAQRDPLFALLNAMITTEEADQAFVDAEKATRAEEWRETVAKLPPISIDAEVIKKADAAIKEVEIANMILEQHRAEEVKAKARREEKRGAFAIALNAWSAVDGRPKTTADLVREGSKCEIERKMRVLSGEISETVVQPLNHQHQIDRVLSGGAHGSSADLGHRRPTRPVRPKP
jgi:hypothetical protein